MMNVDPKIDGILCDTDIEDELKRLLMFRKVVKVEEIDEQTARIYLDDGVILETEGNEGCGGCSNGWYYLTELNGCDNAITNVEVSIDPYETKFVIFIFADDKRINLVSYEGDDNGFYGRGFYLTAYLPK